MVYYYLNDNLPPSIKEMDMKKLVLALSLAVALPNLAIAKNVEQITLPTEQSVQKLVELTLPPDLFLQLLVKPVRDTAHASFTEAFSQHPNYANTTAQQKEEIDQAIRSIVNIQAQQIFKNLSEQKVKQMTVDAYRKFFSQQEVDASIKFYDNPLGKSIAKKAFTASYDLSKMLTKEILSSEWENLGELDEKAQTTLLSEMKKIEMILQRAGK